MERVLLNHWDAFVEDRGNARRCPPLCLALPIRRPVAGGCAWKAGSWEQKSADHIHDRVLLEWRWSSKIPTCRAPPSIGIHLRSIPLRHLLCRAILLAMPSGLLGCNQYFDRRNIMSSSKGCTHRTGGEGSLRACCPLEQHRLRPVPLAITRWSREACPQGSLSYCVAPAYVPLWGHTISTACGLYIMHLVHDIARTAKGVTTLLLG